MNRFYKDGEMDEISRRYNEGGLLYFIERTDTNQFFYEPFNMKKIPTIVTEHEFIKQ